MTKTVWHYSSTRVTLEVDEDSIARVTVTGLQTTAMTEALRRDIVLNCVANKAQACVIDMRKVVAAIDEDMMPMARAIDLARTSKIPVCLVVRAEDEELCLRWAYQMAMDGLYRSVFTDPSDAYDWALLRAQSLTEWPLSS